MSNTLNKQLAVISLLILFHRVDLDFTSLPFICLVTGTNSPISLKLVIPTSNLKLKGMVSISAAMKYLQFLLIPARGLKEYR